MDNIRCPRQEELSSSRLLSFGRLNISTSTCLGHKFSETLPLPSIFISRSALFDFYVTDCSRPGPVLTTFYFGQFRPSALNLSPRVSAPLSDPRTSLFFPLSRIATVYRVSFSIDRFRFSPTIRRTILPRAAAVLRFLFSVPFHASNHTTQKRFSPLFRPVLFYSFDSVRDSSSIRSWLLTSQADLVNFFVPRRVLFFPRIDVSP